MKISAVILGSIISCSFILLLACSEGDDLPEIREEFLTATINHEKFSVNKLNGVVSCEKIFTNYGTVNLIVKVESMEGKGMEFMILNYLGDRNYRIGNRSSIAAGQYSDGWLNYSETNPVGLWSSMEDIQSAGNRANTFRITEDDGNYIGGTFSFAGYEPVSLTSRNITNGKFKLKVLKR